MISSISFCNATATTEIYTLSLHDALPIYDEQCVARVALAAENLCFGQTTLTQQVSDGFHLLRGQRLERSEEHTSELQSRVDLVCRLLLEKKNKTTQDARTSRPLLSVRLKP